MSVSAETRRKAATKAVWRYALVAFLLMILLGGLGVYAVHETRADTARSYAIRLEYCSELEKLKTQNREDLADSRKNYKRNLELLGIKDTPKLRRTVEARWATIERRNRAKACPYDGT